MKNCALWKKEVYKLIPYSSQPSAWEHFPNYDIGKWSQTLGRGNRDWSLGLLKQLNLLIRALKRRKLHREQVPDISIGVTLSLWLSTKLYMGKTSFCVAWQSIVIGRLWHKWDSRGHILLRGVGVLMNQGWSSNKHCRKP